MKKIAPAAALAALALSLSACATTGSTDASSSSAGGAPSAADTESRADAGPAPESSSAAGQSSSTAVISESEVSSASTSAAAGSSDAAPAGDLASQVNSALAGNPHVTEVKSPEEGRVEIDTDLVDPRTDNSAEAQQAKDICKTAVGVGGVTYVSVKEQDGTNWILYGHPLVPKGECGEV